MLMTRETNNAIAETKTQRDCNDIDLRVIKTLITQWISDSTLFSGFAFFPTPCSEREGTGKKRQPGKRLHQSV